MPDDTHQRLAPRGEFLIYADGASQIQARLEGNTFWRAQKLIKILRSETRSVNGIDYKLTGQKFLVCKTETEAVSGIQSQLLFTRERRGVIPNVD